MLPECSPCAALKAAVGQFSRSREAKLSSKQEMTPEYLQKNVMTREYPIVGLSPLSTLSTPRVEIIP